MAGRPPRTEAVKGVYIRIPPALQARVEHCQWLLQRQHGPRVTLNDAFRQTIEAGCEVLEGTLEGKETPAPAQTPIADIAQISISKLSDIAGEDISVPGYGFPEDAEDTAPASPTNGTHAPAPQPTTQPAIPLALEPAPKTAPPVDVPQATETPTSTTTAPAAGKTVPALSEDIVKIADARAQYDKLSERAFIQLLYDRRIYRHKAKDGSEVLLPHSTYRDWMQRAREAGLL
jgi:hypothetical protein